MNADEVYYLNEEQYYDVNKKHFSDFLNKFFDSIKMSKENVNFLYVTYGINLNDPIDQFNFMRHMVLFDDHFIKYKKEFFFLLSQTDYDFNNEIIYFLKMNSKADFGYYMEFAHRHPLIDGVTYGNDVNINVYSGKLGNYTFTPLKAHFLGNNDAMKLITNFVTDNYCHQMSWKLMDYMEKCELITSLVNNYFKGTYYHTYLRNGWKIIDPASSIVMYVDKYNELFKPEEVSIVNNENKNIELESARSLVGNEYADAQAIALAKQIRG